MITLSFPRLRRAARAIGRACTPSASGLFSGISAGRRTALAVSMVLLAGTVQAATQISSVIPTPEIVPAGGTVRTAIGLSDDNGNPVGSPGTSFTFSIPANTIYRGTGAVPVGNCTSTVAAGAAGPGLVTCSGITLAANQTRTFEVLLQTVRAGTLSVVATPAGSNPPSAKTITVNQGADIGLTMDAPASAANAGPLAVTFALVNNGPDGSSGSTLSYPIPPGFTVTSAPGCTIATSLVTCAVGGLALNATRNFTISGTVSAATGSTITHQANVSPTGSVGDGIASNNDATRNTTVTPGSALAMQKSHNGGQILTGQRFNFTLSPSFSGSPPVGASVTDTIPANFQIDAGAINGGGVWTCTVSGQTVSCTRPDIGGTGGANVSLGTITVPVTAISAGSPITNTATVTSGGPLAGSATGQASANVAASDTDFRVRKSLSTGQLNAPVGKPFNYVMNATNLGGTRLLAGSTITLVDEVPAGVQITARPTGTNFTCTVNGGVPTTYPVTGPATVSCLRTLTSDLAVNASVGNVNVPSNVPLLPAGGLISNRACVNVALVGGVDPDTKTGNDCVTIGSGIDDPATQADVLVLKRVAGIGSAAGNRQVAGQPVRWEIEVVNRGQSPAQDIAVTDTFNDVVGGSTVGVQQTPNAATFGGTCSVAAPSAGGGTVALQNCNITALPVCRASTDAPSGLPLCPVIAVNVSHFGSGSPANNHGFTIDNTVNALAATPADPDLGNNVARATAYYTALVDVIVEKSASPTSVPAGQLLTYTLTARNRDFANQSYSTAYNVEVEDRLPANLMFLSASANGGGSCSVQPSTAQPTGTTANNRLVCSWPSIVRGGQQTVTVRMRPLAVLGGTSVTNNVTTTTATPENVANNNSSSAPAAITAPDYDLVVAKTDSVDPAMSDENVSYTLTLSNNRPSTAENVRLVDILPTVGTIAGQLPPTFVSATGPAGTSVDLSGVTVGQGGGRVVFNVPVLGGSGTGQTGEPSTLKFTVVLKGVGKGIFTNRAEASFVESALNAFDALPGNNTITEPTTFRFRADVEVVGKQAVVRNGTAPLATVAGTQTFDWLVQLRNNGPQAAEITQFRDTLPAGMQVAAAPVFTVTGGVFTPTAPVCAAAVGGNSVACDIDSMPNGGTATVRIPVRFAPDNLPAQNAVFTNTATLVTTGSGDTNGGTDPLGGNNHNAGQVTVQNSALSGRVYEDLDGNGQPASGEPGIAGVTLTLTGTDAAGNTVPPLTVVTDANGAWAFTVPAGTYTVTETQPAAYLPGVTRAGTIAGTGTPGSVPTGGAGVTSGPNGSNANLVQGIVLGAGGASVNNNFGEVRAASVAGRVFHDADYSGASSAGDPGIAGVAIALSGTDMFGNAVTRDTTTAATTGAYSFADLLPGTYALAETQPANFADGPDALGTASGNATTNDRFGAIVLTSNVAATGYEFGELLTRIPVQVFVDDSNDGVPQAGEAGIGNVVLRLTGTDAAGNAVNLLAVATDTPGGYEFRNVPPSNGTGYTITETQPANYAPGKANANGHPGTAQAGGNVISTVTVTGPTPPLSQGTYYFGELVPGGVSGRVYYDRDGSGLQNGTEPGIAGVSVTLTGTDTNGNPVTRTLVTDANGDYAFATLAPGSYTVTESRPTGYQPGITRAGTASGAGSAPGSVPTTGNGTTAGPRGSTANVIQGIVLGLNGAGSANNNFSAVRPASLAGHVYADVAPANGKRDAGEPGIAGVTVNVTGTDFLGNAVTQALTTDADGAYAIATLLPGSYQLDETQPTGVADGAESVGTVAGTPRGTANPGGTNDRIGAIALVSEEAGIDYDFGERGGQIGGWTYVDGNNDGVRQPGEPGIPGVTLMLTGRSASGLTVNATAVSDANGQYVFTGLLPADAAGYTVRETQPVTYADGLDAVGTLEGKASGTLGNDVISAIAYAGGNGDNYNFGERGASLAGTVYNDANGNGTREPQDLPIAGVTITLTGTDAAGHPVTRSAVTDANGKYLLTNLPMPDGAGYTLTETQPAGYDEGIAKPGTLGGAARGPNVIQVSFATPAVDGTGYDFNERNNQPAALSGKVWFDANHNRSADSGEGGGEGWTVELMRCADGSNGCAETALVPQYSVVTGADGGYRFGDLTPGEYRVRFRTPDGRRVGGTWPTDALQNGAAGPYPTPAPSDPRYSIKVRVAPGANVLQQDLPYDPGGVVYDSVSATPVPGAVVTLVGPPGFDPAQHLLDGRDSYATGVTGGYDFFLLPGAPAGEYRLTVTPPGAYLPSSIYPPAAGAFGTQTCSAPANGPSPAQTNPCVMSPGGALVAGAGYYLLFQMPAGGGQRVVANNIPLDPANSTLIELRKTTSKLTVKKGELLPYRITARNTRGVPLTNVAVVDTLPPGFRFVAGSLSVRTLPGGVALPVVPQLNGRQLVVPGQNFAGNETKEYVMVAGVGVGVGEGEYVNQVIANQGVGGRVLSNLATAAVRVIPDALFDCTDVIGTVYDDKNANGYQDDGEPGIANARVATVNGLLVTTDAEGRYHIACAAIPKEGTGSNLVLKVDERTLPSGYRTTSENPAAERATRGKVLKVNFGATVHRVVRLALQSSAFENGGTALRTAHATQITQALTALAEKPSVLRLAYRAADGEPESLGKARAAALKADLLARWKALGRERADESAAPLFNLDIEVEQVPASAKP
ncbi:SdrD B-like domain-containing protein [Variovorax guangxiensis]|nr:SdrD B-like domain-containing protein [Variovorax guangxiensis]